MATPPTPAPSLSPASGLLATYGEVHYRARTKRLDAPPAEALAKALEHYLAEGWRELPTALRRRLDLIGEQRTARILSGVNRVLESVQYVWDSVIDWNDPRSVRSAAARLPAYVAIATNGLVASRLLDSSDADIQLESELVGEMLRVAMWTGRIREMMAIHRLSVAEIAPSAFAAASAIEHETEGPAPREVRLGNDRVAVPAPAGVYATLISSDEATDARILAELAQSVRVVLEMKDVPDLGTAASFESHALGLDRKRAMERVIESVFLAQREREGRSHDSAAQRLVSLRGIMIPALERISQATKWGQAIHGIYERAWKHIDQEKVRLEELAARAGRSKDAPPPDSIVIPIPDGFDGVTAFGLYLQESVMIGDPLSLVWGQISDWGEPPQEGGFSLSPDEQKELANLTLYAALSYAADHSADHDPMIERIVRNSGRSFLRERFREIEMELRSRPHLSDAEMLHVAEEMMNHLAETGAVRRADVAKHLTIVGGMIDRIRAHTEVRRLMAHRSLSDSIPTTVLRNLDRLPHAKRHGERAAEHALWLNRSRNGQTRLDLMSDVVARVREYRRHARDQEFNVEPFSNPTDRWDEDLTRRVGRFRAPRFHRHIGADPADEVRGASPEPNNRRRMR